MRKIVGYLAALGKEIGLAPIQGGVPFLMARRRPRTSTRWRDSIRIAEGWTIVLLPLFFFLLWWHPVLGEIDRRPSVAEGESGEVVPANRDILEPDDHQILIERARHRLLLFRGNALMAIFPIGAMEDGPPVPTGRYVICRFARDREQGVRLHLSRNSRPVNAPGSLSAGRRDRDQQAHQIASLAGGRVPLPAVRQDGTVAIVVAGADPVPGWGMVSLQGEHLRQLVDLVRIGTPVSIR